MEAGLHYRPFAAVIIALLLCGCRQRSATQSEASAQAKTATQSPLEFSNNSGVFGFAGAGVPFNDPEGVIGECIWIFDAGNRSQVARGDCAEATPGRFRVPLRPGRYVVHGPGGNRSIEVKAGKWVKVVSVASLPMAP